LKNKILLDLKTLGNLEKAKFLDRPNRFKAIIKKEKNFYTCHVADPGRLKEIFIPGREVIVIKNKPNLKTDYKLVAINVENEWVLLNTSLHSKIAEKAINYGVLGFKPNNIKKEVSFGNSRIDFLVNNDTFIELKGTNLKVNNCCLFPDAPTKRGARHMRELAQAIKEGYKSFVLFMAVRNCKCFKPNKKLDKEFAEAFYKALNEGVRFRGFKIKLNIDDFTIELGDELKLCE